MEDSTHFQFAQHRDFFEKLASLGRRTLTYESQGAAKVPAGGRVASLARAYSSARRTKEPPEQLRQREGAASPVDRIVTRKDVVNKREVAADVPENNARTVEEEHQKHEHSSDEETDSYDDSDEIYDTDFSDSNTDNNDNSSGAYDMEGNLDDIISNHIEDGFWMDAVKGRDPDRVANLSQVEIALQHSKYEILTTELAYLKYLELVCKHYKQNIANMFMNNPTTVSRYDLKQIFGNIEDVTDVSRGLLCDLDEMWDRDILMADLLSLLEEKCPLISRVYVQYADQYKLMIKHLDEKMEAKGQLRQLISNLNNHPTALKNGQDLNSMLHMPVQRCSRYRLMLEAVLEHTQDTEQHSRTAAVLDMYTQVAEACNQAVDMRTRALEMESIVRILEFDSKVPFQKLDVTDRYLIRRDYITVYNFSHSSVATWRRNRQDRRHLFLFNDLVLITKENPKKGLEEFFLVVDYCSSSEVSLGAGLSHHGVKNLMCMFLNGNVRKNNKLHFTFENESDIIEITKEWLRVVKPSRRPVAFLE